MNCGDCTLCCKLLEIKDTDSKPGEYCSFYEPGTGCNIYDKRPESCRIFECAWKQMEHTAEDLRPDKCGVLFEKWTDYVMVGTTEYKLSDLILGQIDYFREEGISILMINHKEKSRTFYLAQGHNKQFVRDEINGSSKLHRRSD